MAEGSGAEELRPPTTPGRRYDRGSRRLGAKPTHPTGLTIGTNSPLHFAPSYLPQQFGAQAFGAILRDPCALADAQCVCHGLSNLCHCGAGH